MKLFAFASQYVYSRQLRKTPMYSAARFGRLIRDMDIGRITEKHLREFKSLALESGLSPHTVKGSLKDLRTLIRASGRQVTIERVPVPPPNPSPVDHESIDTIWPCLSLWAQQWVVLAFWTAARLSDVIRIQQSLTDTTAAISIVASKTGHKHHYPIPDWIRPWLKPQRLPYKTRYDWAGHQVRQALKAASAVCGLNPIEPNHIRDRALNNWQEADHFACEIIHGQSLGTLKHYLSSLEILSRAAPRVKLPSCFGASVDISARMMDNFRRLDPSAQDLLVSTAERLAR